LNHSQVAVGDAADLVVTLKGLTVNHSCSLKSYMSASCPEYPTETPYLSESILMLFKFNSSLGEGYVEFQ